MIILNKSQQLNDYFLKLQYKTICFLAQIHNFCLYFAFFFLIYDYFMNVQMSSLLLKDCFSSLKLFSRYALTKYRGLKSLY